GMLAGEIAAKSLVEAIGEALHGRSGNRLSSTGERLAQIVLGQELARLSVMRDLHFKHLVIEHARFSQAAHQQTILFLRCVEPVLERLHGCHYILIGTMFSTLGAHSPTRLKPVALCAYGG